MNLYAGHVGNVFVDAGVYAMAALRGVLPEALTAADLTALVNKHLPQYPKWDKSFAGIFTSNHPLRRNKKEAERERVKKWMQHLHAEIHALENSQGTEMCYTCGTRHGKPYLSNVMPLSATGPMRNFCPNHQEGSAVLCGACLIAVHFVPYAAIRFGNSHLLPHTANSEFMQAWTRQTTLNVQRLKDTPSAFQVDGANGEPLKSVSAMFNIVTDFKRRLRAHDEVWLYHFNNNPQHAQGRLTIHHVPAAAFNFVITAARSDTKADFHDTVNGHWRDGYNAVYAKLLKNFSIEHLLKTWALARKYMEEFNMSERALMLESIAAKLRVVQEHDARIIQQLQHANNFSEFDTAIAAAAAVNRDIDFATIDMLCLCPEATLQWKSNRRWLCHLLRIEVEAAEEDDDEDA